MMRKKLIKPLFVTFVCLGLNACTSEDDAPALYGAPTTMAQSETPIDTICRIQAEFRELPKPLMASMGYQPPWTSYNLGAASVDHRGYHTVQLTQAGLEFLHKHSRLELVISLTPLFAEPEIGGEAAVLLAGIPAGNKSVQGGKTANLANALDEVYYRSPQRPGDWLKKAAQYYSRVTNLYSFGNQTQSIHRMRPENLSTSLEARIINELHRYSDAPLKLFDEKPYMPQPHNEDLVIEWIAQNTAPVLNSRAQKYVESDNANFTALALFPFLPSPLQSGLSRDEILMMYLLNVEDKYWPAMMYLSSGQKLINQLRAEFKQQVPKTFDNLCQ